MFEHVAVCTKFGFFNVCCSTGRQFSSRFNDFDSLNSSFAHGLRFIDRFYNVVVIKRPVGINRVWVYGFFVNDGGFLQFVITV